NPSGNIPGMSTSYVNVTGEPSRAISERFANMAYDFFLGKRMAYPVVANYVRNTWGKYGLFGLNSMVSLVTAFNEDALSVIPTKLGTPLMLDSYTFDMCIQYWGRSSYARALIKIRADVELKDNIMVAMPKLVGESFYTCNIRVEHE
ncbi:hypothetical protein Tco_0220874, partial [Tanacetum coccineum]